MADFSKRGPGCDDECGEGERGKRGKRGRRGPAGPAGGPGPIVTDPTPPTLAGDGTPEHPLQVINVAPQPFTSPLEKRFVYVRATGSDETGDGSQDNPYRTVQQAVLDVPLFIPGGVQYIVDCTNLIDGGPELLPPEYQLPRWVADRAFDAGDFSDPFYLVQCAVMIRADLRAPAALGANATINFEDLVATDVGGGITNVTNGPNPEVTTVNPNLLFLVQDDFIQQVTISGVTGTTSANGTWFVEVTGPNTFILKGADTSGDPAYAGGGVATTQYVQDQISGQVQIKVNSPRWTPGALKGLQFVDQNFNANPGVIYDNTADTLFITQVFPPAIAPGLPGLIAEQSAELRCAPPTTFGFIGGFNCINQDSLGIAGLIISVSDPDSQGVHHQYGNVWFQGCKLENPGFSRTTQANSGHTYLINPDYSQTPIYQFADLVEGGFHGGLNWWDCYGGTVFINQVNPLGILDDGGFAGWFGVMTIDHQGDAFVSSQPHGSINRFKIQNGQGNAFFIDGPGHIVLNGVGGTWTGDAVVARAGAQVEVTEESFNDAFSAGPNTMAVGTLPTRTFAGFRGNPPDGGELHNQFDVAAFNAPGFGASGTGARVFQEPYPAP
jgi:hypothetical protein